MNLEGFFSFACDTATRMQTFFSAFADDAAAATRFISQRCRVVGSIALKGGGSERKIAAGALTAAVSGCSQFLAAAINHRP